MKTSAGQGPVQPPGRVMVMSPLHCWPLHHDKCSRNMSTLLIKPSDHDMCQLQLQLFPKSQVVLGPPGSLADAAHCKSLVIKFKFCPHKHLAVQASLFKRGAEAFPGLACSYSTQPLTQAQICQNCVRIHACTFRKISNAAPAFAAAEELLCRI